MKKQIISCLTALMVCVSVLSAPDFYEGFCAAAFEIMSEEVEYDEELQLTPEIIEEYSVELPSYDYYYNEDTFSFYDQLDANNKAAYEAMQQEWINPSEDGMTVELAETLSFTNDSASMSDWTEEETDEFWAAIMASMYSAKNAFLFDYPEVFWVDESLMSLSASSVRVSKKSSQYTIKVSAIDIYYQVKEEYGSVEEAEACKQQLETAIDEFDVQGSDNYQKLLYIHDAIANKVSYNIEGIYSDSAFGFFFEPYEIVCEGYSKAFKILCDKENIPCILVVGNVDTTDNTAHMWNYVQMEDGEWYGIDVTWDDLDSDTNPVKYAYFLKGSENFKGHTPDTEHITPEFTYPELSTSDYLYESSIETTQATTTAITSTTETTTTVIVTESTTESTTVTTTVTIPVTTVQTVTTIPETTDITVTTTVNTFVKGDYNNNGKLDNEDLSLFADKLVGKEEITESDYAHNMNEDDVLNIYDYIIIKRKLERGIYY